MQITIDGDVCMGTGQCELFCPDVFEVDDVASVKVSEVDESMFEAVRDAADACPTQAITVTE